MAGESGEGWREGDEGEGEGEGDKASKGMVRVTMSGGREARVRGERREGERARWVSHSRFCLLVFFFPPVILTRAQRPMGLRQNHQQHLFRGKNFLAPKKIRKRPATPNRNQGSQFYRPERRHT
jgi:hypothetical protein